MTRVQRPPDVEQKIVLVFDICSSSNILEDLTLSGSLKSFRKLLASLKRFLEEQSGILDFEVYKFTGDGWILLFPPDTDGERLMTFVTRLAKFYKHEFKKTVAPFLQSKPGITGLTFGLDAGPLISLTMHGRREYVGRALNIACRLQSAIKDKDDRPANKILASKPIFRNLLRSLKIYEPVEVSRTLRNIIGGGRYQCIKMRLPV
jgi:class 3 adenylate cyclase